MPTGPGVYRYLDENERVLYVGKAKNLRRRLANYRNATRKKVHRKLRLLVREAHALVYETCETEQAALLREGEYIRTLRPPYNVDGAFAFLYPSLGLRSGNEHTLLCFTTQPEQFRQLELEWYGCFRSRPRVKDAFSVLVELLTLIAHREKASQLPPYPRLKGSRLVGLRRVPREVSESLPDFFGGKRDDLLGKLARCLLAKPRALQESTRVEQDLKLLRHFYQVDAERLRTTLSALGRTGCHVSQDERDALFISVGSAHSRQ